MAKVWDPWRELRDREHIIFELDRIAKIGGGALYVKRGNVAAIVIDPDLGRRERRAALAHELVHDERGGIDDDATAPRAWHDVVAREEVRVERIAATRLVPLPQLDAWLRRRAGVSPVLLADVADEFDVPDHVALIAVRLLGERRARAQGVEPQAPTVFL